MPEVEVVHATPDEVLEAHLTLDDGATVADALAVVAARPGFDRLDLADAAVGIFGETVARETALESGDRVEIYRPLVVGPRQMRKERAERRR